MVCGKGALPTPPETCIQLTEMLGSPYTDIGDVGRFVEQDPGLSTKLLNIVNSAHFGTARRIVTPTEAVQIIGIEVLKALMLGAHAFHFYDEKPFARISFKELWSHSLETAIRARKIAEMEQFKTEDCEGCFLAGLLHDVGKLILAANAEQEYRLVLDLCQKAALELHQAEMGIFSSTHAQIGAYLLALWGLPDSVIRAVEIHHSLDSSRIETFEPAVVLHVAQNLMPNRKRNLNMPLLRKLKLEHRLQDWEAALQAER
jgi:putative nucleotidyltransferase with HDIG domain